MSYTKPEMSTLDSSIKAIQGTSILTKTSSLNDEASGHQGEQNQAVNNAYEADE
jgi:hypothetical protein